MEDKSKLFVFEKKEVLLMFIFMVVIASTAFTVGVRMGMKWQLEKEGITSADIEEVKLKSQNEEHAEKILNQPDDETFDLKEEANQRLKDEIERAGKTGLPNAAKPEQEPEATPAPTIEKKTPVIDTTEDTKSLIDSYNMETNTEESAQPDKEVQISNNNESDKLKGKYTVQVGAYKTFDEAKSFASGFEVRGYTPIVNEVKIDNKGTWYRVSIGAFDTRNEARDYIVKEKSLFQSYDYIIKKIE